MSLWRRILTERRVVLLPLATILVINVLVSALAVVPLARSVAGDELRAENVKRTLNDAHRLARTANSTKASQTRAGDELQRFYADILPAGLPSARAMLYPDITAFARETGLRHRSSVFAQEEVEGSNLIKCKTDVSLNGDYAAVRRFLYLLETSEQFYVVEGVRLGQSSGAAGGGALEVVLNLATYYSRDAAAGGGR